MTAPAFLMPSWPAPPGIRAVTSLRQGGLSQGAYASFNIGDHVGDHPASVEANRRLLQATLQLPATPCWLSQVHGVAVQVLPAPPATGPVQPVVADGSYTREPGQVCAVLTADCLPVLFCSEDGQEVAAAHAGWRGLAAGILPETLAHFRSPPRSVMAWLGPAIGPRSFEVGEDVRQGFLSQGWPSGPAAVARCFSPGANGHWWCDLYALARLQLHGLGVESVWGGGEDTFADPARYFSYRRDGVTGRMVSLVWRTGQDRQTG